MTNTLIYTLLLGSIYLSKRYFKNVKKQKTKCRTMKKATIKKELSQILMNMGIAEKAIMEQASFYKDLGLDSLDFTELIMELECTFATEIPTLEAEKIQTIHQATEYLNQRLKSAA